MEVEKDGNSRSTLAQLKMGSFVHTESARGFRYSGGEKLHINTGTHRKVDPSYPATTAYGALFTYTVLLSAPPGPLVPVKAWPPRSRNRGVCVGEINGLTKAAALYTLALGIFEPVRPFQEDSEPSELTVLLSNSLDPGLPL